MNKKDIILDSGIKVTMINTNKFKTVNVTLFFEDQINDFNITCDNLLMRLLTTKTSKHPSRQSFKGYLKDLYDTKISFFANDLGETFSFYLNVDALNKKFTLNNENLLEKQFEILNEVIYSPLVNDKKFDEEYFKECLETYKQERLNQENYKEFVVNQKVNEILGKDNKLFAMNGGYIEEINKLKNEDVYNKYQNINSLCKNIVVCGEIDFDEVINLINKYLKFDSNRNKYNYYHKNEFVKYEDTSYDSKFNQSSIAILYDLNIYNNDHLYYPALVFIELFNHYLFKVVREEYNFCYSIYCAYYSTVGLCCLRSNIESKNYEKTLELTNKIIDDLKVDIDEKILNICKEKLINGIKKEVDNPLKMMVKEYYRGIYNLATNSETCDYISKINGEDVKKVASMMKKKFNVILKEEQVNG